MDDLPNDDIKNKIIKIRKLNNNEKFQNNHTIDTKSNTINQDIYQLAILNSNDDLISDNFDNKNIKHTNNNVIKNSFKNNRKIKIPLIKNEIKPLKINNFNNIQNLHSFIYEDKNSENNDIKIHNNYNINEKKNSEQQILSEKNIDLNIISITTREENEFIKKNITEKDNNKKIKPVCIICKRIFSCKEIYYTNGCNHTFCINCIKQYFLNLILQGETNIEHFKCLIPTCNEIYNKEIIMNIIPNFYIQFLNNNHQNPMNYSNKIMKELNNIKINSNFDEYSKKNVLNINSNELFFLYSKNKADICNKCCKNSIYYPKDNIFKICLLCRTRYCKFCNNEYNDFHFEKENPEHCKIFFKCDSENNKNNKNIINILFYYILIVFGFFIIYLGYSKIIERKLKQCFFNNEKYILKKNDLCLFYLIKIILFFILMIIIYFILLIFMVLIFPYFPLITFLSF